MNLHRAGEDYLKTILILQRAGRAVRSVDVAEKLRVSKPSVGNAIKQLRQDGYLAADTGRKLVLTEAGRRAAEQVYGRYAVLKAWLLRLGVPEAVAERDACEMEHVVSPETVARLQQGLP